MFVEKVKCGDKMNDITAIILTKNEEVNIEKCINSIKKITSEIYVIDSGSIDKTVQIAIKNGARVMEHEFISHGNQFNWALDNIDIKTKWIIRVDADEVITQDLSEEIITQCKLHSNDNVNAFQMKFKLYFLGRFLMHGGVYPFCKVNIFKYNIGRYNEKDMCDDVILNHGIINKLKNDALHYDNKDVFSLIAKHNWYATMETKNYFDSIENNVIFSSDNDAKKRKFLKNSLYYKLPIFLRAKLYFIYRYYIKLGFLDGKSGKIYAFIQAYFYRYAVDSMIIERKINEKKY